MYPFSLQVLNNKLKEYIDRAIDSPSADIKIKPIIKYNNMTTYNEVRYFGKDDLISVNPLHVDDWGSEHFHPAFGITRDWYSKNPLEYASIITLFNENYKQELVKNNIWYKPYISSITLMDNPMFDDKEIPVTPLVSHKLYFLDFSK